MRVELPILSSLPLILATCAEKRDAAAAGENRPYSGRHQLLIDTDPPEPGRPVPRDDRHVHSGDRRITVIVE